MKTISTISTKDMTHEEWLQARKSGIGGSDAGAICGLNPYTSPLAVYQDKVSETVEEKDNEAMRQRIMLPDVSWKKRGKRCGELTSFTKAPKIRLCLPMLTG